MQHLNMSGQRLTRSHIKRIRCERWIHLLCLEWFSCWLDYLSLKEIAQLDSAFCNHSDRRKWLDSLKCYRPSRYVTIYSENFAKWLILKNIQLRMLVLKVSISEEVSRQLFQNSSNLKTLRIIKNTNNNDMILSFESLRNLATNCQQLELLDMRNIQTPEGGLEVLSTTCHQLQYITLTNVDDIQGLNKLIQMNNSLIDLHIETYHMHGIGEIFENLGQHCSHIEYFEYKSTSTTEIEATHAQIETFTRGCPKLESLSLNFGIAISTSMYDNLFHCLGNFNPSLTRLNLFSFRLSTLSPENVINDSLRCLSNGCPLLSQFTIANTRVSAQAITYLVKHNIHLETLILSFCCICDDRLTITKEADKLKHLKRLDLSYNRNINDESIINLVKGCHTLEKIYIQGCPKLTDSCLFSIAANCPQLKTIYMDFDGNQITKRGLKELFNKCPKFIEIFSHYRLPNQIQDEMSRRRKTRILRIE